MAKDIGAPTPQSDNPSPWPASKQVSVVLPPGSTEQLPTPDQSEGVMVNGLCIVEGIPSDGRGKRLTWDEVGVLVRLCMERTAENEISTRPKKWWMESSEQLYARTRRSYSWQSCKRRMQQLVYACRVHRDGITNYFDYEDSSLQRDLRQMPPDLCSEMVQWVNKTDRKNKTDRNPAVEPNDDEAELTRRALLARGIPPRKVAEELEKERREREIGERPLETDYPKRKHDRVWKWLGSLPPAVEMVSALHPDDEYARIERGRNAGLGQRDRSRSPRPEAANYRQRSPLGRREPQPTTSTPAGKYFQPDLLRNSREQDVANNQKTSWFGQRLPGNDLKPTSSQQQDLAMRLEDTVNDLANDFVANHMYPLMCLDPNTDGEIKEEAATLACYDLFRNMAKITLELMSAAGLPTPPYPATE